jgi:hypothetical protein
MPKNQSSNLPPPLRKHLLLRTALAVLQLIQ